MKLSELIDRCAVLLHDSGDMDVLLSKDAEGNALLEIVDIDIQTLDDLKTLETQDGDVAIEEEVVVLWPSD